eukprot:4105748-Amphidinium_carterae.1
MSKLLVNEARDLLQKKADVPPQLQHNQLGKQITCKAKLGGLYKWTQVQQDQFHRLPLGPPEPPPRKKYPQN